MAFYFGHKNHIVCKEKEIFALELNHSNEETEVPERQLFLVHPFVDSHEIVLKVDEELVFGELGLYYKLVTSVLSQGKSLDIVRILNL